MYYEPVCMRLVIWLVPFLLVVVQSGASAQQSRSAKSRYVRIPVNGDIETLLKSVLKQADAQRKSQEDLQKWLKLLEKRFKTKLDAKRLQKLKKQINFDNPKVRKKIEKWIDQHRDQLPVNDEQVKKLKESLRNWKLPNRKLPGPGNPPGFPNQIDPQPPGAPGPPDIPPRAEPDPLQNKLRNILDDFDHSKLREWFGDDEFFEDFLVDFAAEIINDDGSSGWDMDEFTDWFARSLTVDTGGDDDSSNGWSLGGWSMPSFPALNLGGFGGSGASYNQPRAPALGGLAPVGIVIMSLAGLVVLVVIVLRKAPWSPFSRLHSPSWVLGPWPVQPAAVRTPAELIAAFHYLAQMLFGPEVSSANHLDVALRLSQRNTADAGQAALLAELYERARYAPAHESMSDEAMDKARRSLCALAGVAAPTAA